MQGLHEAPCFLIRGGNQRPPLRRLQGSGGEHGRRYRKPVGDQILEEAEGQRAAGDRTGRGRAKAFVDLGSIGADGFKCLRDDLASALRARARDKIHKLSPAHGGVVAIARGLAQHGQQTIVETHF